MDGSEIIPLKRDCEAAVVPSGMTVTLQEGEEAQITQALGLTRLSSMETCSELRVKTPMPWVRSLRTRVFRISTFGLSSLRASLGE